MAKTRRKNLTAEELGQLKKLWSQGLSKSEISEKTGLRYNTVNSFFVAFNKGFDSAIKYQNHLALEKGFINSWEKYVVTNQQRFEQSFSCRSLLDLFSKINQQRDYRIVHPYEIDPHELIPKLLNELEKVKGGNKFLSVIKSHYFQSKTLRKIASEQGVRDYQVIDARNRKALEKLREIVQRTEFSEMV